MYKALACRVNSLRSILGADRIQVATVGAYQVVVGMDVQEGALGVFFEQGGVLSEGFASQNDLVERKDENGNRAGGFFKENRRVKAIRLKGCRSEGFWCPIEFFAYTGYDLSQLREGDQFDRLGESHPICAKYITPATRRSQRQGGEQSRGETLMFKKHPDTEGFKRSAAMIPAGSIIYLSSKLHGTSGRTAHVLDEVEIKRKPVATLFARLFRRPTHSRIWTHLNGSRNVILEKRTGEGFYGKEDFRFKAVEGISLKKGECIFYELVGYTETEQTIMASQSTSALKDKSVEKQFGKEVVYKYGCLPGQCRLFVYRITSVNEDGHAVELSWQQVAARCKELGLQTVPTFETFIYDGNLETLQKKISLLTDGESGSNLLPSRLDPSHPEEGIVIRYESEHGTGWLKSKSFYFGVLEGYQKEENPEAVDLEEAS